MLDTNDLLNSIKKAAQETVEAGKPVNVSFGQVISSSPLKINIEQKMILSEEQLVLTRNVTDYTVNVTINWDTNETSLNANHTHELKGDVSVKSTATVNPNPDNENVEVKSEVDNSLSIAQKNINLKHAHYISGTKNMKIHNGLQVGEKVVLVREQGGQKYIVLDRVV